MSPLRFALAALVAPLVTAAGCGDFKSSAAPATGNDAEAPDGAAPGDDGSSPGDGASPQADGARPNGDGGPNAPCRPVVLECLDATPANVIEVPTESTAQAAFANAKANDTIQIKGGGLGAGWRVPAFVTLRGCAGAKIAGDIGFAGTAGTIEGFDVQASIVANQTGSYIVRQNRFGGTASGAGIQALSRDGIVSASVTMLVEANAFTGRPAGVLADTNYDTGTHEVTITVQNSLFVNVASPISLSEGGLVGKITAKVWFNTFYGFQKAISIYGVKPTTTTIGNLFAHGDGAIDANSPYDVDFSFVWQVKTPTPQVQPLSGTFATGDPAFIDATNGDLRLGATSAEIDRIPNGTAVPNTDYFGCPRPRAYSGTDPKSDIGAIEAQP